MKKQIMILIASVMLISLITIGCGSKAKVEMQTPEQTAKMQGDPVQNLAVKEKAWLVNLDKIRTDISQSYTAWEQGKATREDFINQLTISKESVKSLKKDYDFYMKVNSFPDSKKSEAIYKDGLVYGKNLRTTVNNFIFMVTEGVLDTQTNELKKLTNDQIKEFYKHYMIDQYGQYKTKLEPSLVIANTKK